MAARSVSGITRRVFMWKVSGSPHREFWSRSRKEIEPVVTETAEEVKKESILVCPPLRNLQSRLESYVKNFFLLVHLADDLGHIVPNSRLHQMCRVRDVLEFYNIPVQDRSKFDELSASNLPPNLKITWSY
uniref:Large ribosomal subunit protein mL50 n=1 Tax=Aotus nancymaae TaxID=37293 RepID=A0A2K5BUM7_AOTNA